MSGTVRIESTCIIRPISPTSPQHMFLPSIDSLWRWFHYNQRILFYKFPSSSTSLSSPPSSDSFVSDLKRGLAVALVEFFPWAGRVFERPGDGRLTLDCNDAGVPFIEAQADLPFSILESDGFRHRSFFRNFAPHGEISKWTGPDLPLLSVQVTRFPADEGFILGVAHSHIVADGTSLWHFLKSWGECTRGVPLSMHPVHMREAFGPDNLILPPPCAEEDKGNGFFEMLEADLGKNNLVQRDFHFTSEMVIKLKQMANDSLSAEHKPFSSLQAVTAHIWRHVIAVTDLEKNEKSIFFVIANMRSRLNPPLPEGYFGNAIIRDGAIARKEELQGESLGATALRIQELIDSLDDTKTRSFYGKVEVLPFEKVLEGLDFSMFSLQVSSSPRFPVYDVDFGLGKPLCARCPFIHGAGEMMWFPGKDAGSIDIGFALPKFIMEKLEQDDRFLHF